MQEKIEFPPVAGQFLTGARFQKDINVFGCKPANRHIEPFAVNKFATVPQSRVIIEICC
jgi:hypothetical protein